MSNQLNKELPPLLGGGLEEITPTENTEQLILTTTSGDMTIDTDFTCTAISNGDLARSDAIFPYDTTKRYISFKGPAFAQGGVHYVGIIDSAGPTMSFGVGIYRDGVDTDYRLGELIGADNTGDIAFAYDDTAEYALAYDSNAGANGTVWFYENGVEVDNYALVNPLPATPDAFGFYCATIGGPASYELVENPAYPIAGATHVNLVGDGTINPASLQSGGLFLTVGMAGPLTLSGQTIDDGMILAIDFDGTFLGVVPYNADIQADIVDAGGISYSGVIASAPDPATNDGDMVRFTDVGRDNGSLWESVGAAGYRPASQVLNIMTEIHPGTFVLGGQDPSAGTVAYTLVSNLLTLTYPVAHGISAEFNGANVIVPNGATGALVLEECTGLTVTGTNTLTMTCTQADTSGDLGTNTAETFITVDFVIPDEIAIEAGDFFAPAVYETMRAASGTNSRRTYFNGVLSNTQSGNSTLIAAPGGGTMVAHDADSVIAASVDSVPRAIGNKTFTFSTQMSAATQWVYRRVVGVTMTRR